MGTMNLAGAAAGAAVGIGVGAATMLALGRTQEKADANGANAKVEQQLVGKRTDVQQRLDAGMKSGTITVQVQRDLERQIREIDTQIGEIDGGSRLLNENWPMIPGLLVAGGLGKGAGYLDGQMNYSWKSVVTRPGSKFEISGAPFGRGDKFGMVRDAQIGKSFLPSFVGGAAVGLAAGMLGARLVQQFTNRPE